MDQLLQAVEALVDEKGLSRVLDAVAKVCLEKADHISESYSDHALAKRWAFASGIVSHAADRIQRAQV